MNVKSCFLEKNWGQFAGKNKKNTRKQDLTFMQIVSINLSSAELAHRTVKTYQPLWIILCCRPEKWRKGTRNSRGVMKEERTSE